MCEKIYDGELDILALAKEMSLVDLKTGRMMEPYIDG